MDDSDAGGVVLGTWCASQVPDAQTRVPYKVAYIIDIVKRFMTTVAHLLVVHATVYYLRLPPKTASHEPAWRRWREGVLLMVAIICVAACY